MVREVRVLLPICLVMLCGVSWAAGTLVSTTQKRARLSAVRSNKKEIFEKDVQRCLSNDISETSRKTDQKQGAECEGGRACLFHIPATGRASFGKDEGRHPGHAVLQGPPEPTSEGENSIVRPRQHEEQSLPIEDTLRAAREECFPAERVEGEVDSSWHGGRLGLVLSGGGARGLAHIGVLRALDEMGVRPDYITGTSMGAVIGGLYAIGYSAEQISQLNREADWNVLLSRHIDMRKVTIDQKPAFSRSIFSFVLRDKRLQLRLGYIEGQNLWDYFLRLTWPVIESRHFDSFQIPFRCCAGDLQTGECCMLDSGSLAVAIRASMAVPGFFTPVITPEGRVFVDGGVCDNLPVDAAFSLGADRIISVNTGPQQGGKVDFGLRRLLTNSAMYFTVRKVRDDMARSDVAIEPVLEGVSSMNFAGGREAELRGYLATLSQREKIMQLMRRMGRPTVASSSRCPLDLTRLNDSVAVDSIVIDVEAPALRRFARRASGLEAPMRMTRADAQSAVDKLMGSLYFSRVVYHVDSLRRFHLVPQPAPRLELSFAANVNDAWGASAIARLRFLNPFSKVSRLDFAVEVAAQPRMLLSYTAYMSRGMRAFARFDVDYTSERLPYYVNNQNVAAVWKHGLGAQGSVGYMPQQNVCLALGARYAFVSQIPNREYNTWVGLKSEGKYRQQSVRLYFDFRCNTFSRPYCPPSGQEVVANVAYAFNSPLQSYSALGKDAAKQQAQRDLEKPYQLYTVNFRYRGIFPLWDAVFLEPGLQLGLNSRPAGRFSSYLVGGGRYTVRDELGDIPFYGIGYRQLSASSVWGVSLDVRLRVWKELFFVTRLNYAQLNDTMEGLFRQFLHPAIGLLGGSAAAVWVTPLGPMAVSVSLANQTQKVWLNFSLGYTF